MTDPTLELAATDDTEPRWQIDSVETLDWALEQLATARRQIAEARRLHEAAMARLEARLRAATATHQRSAEYFEASARAYAEEHRGELLTGKAKSRALPNGTIGWRRTGGGLRVVDEEAAMTWALSTDSRFVRTRQELNKAEVNALFKSTGEVIPGCDVEEARDTCYVKVDDE